VPDNNGREKFAMVPESVVRGKGHDGCVDVFAFPS
jgi:hypothetical protein